MRRRWPTLPPSLVISTERVYPDEKAYLLVERNLVRPPKLKLHRYQIIYVNRGGELAEFWDDRGPTTSDVGEFRIPSLWEHTVGELWDFADHARKSNEDWAKVQQELQEESTLTRDFLDYAEERQQWKHRRTVLGPALWKQRSW